MKKRDYVKGYDCVFNFINCFILLYRCKYWWKENFEMYEFGILLVLGEVLVFDFEIGIENEVEIDCLIWYIDGFSGCNFVWNF